MKRILIVVCLALVFSIAYAAVDCLQPGCTADTHYLKTVVKDKYACNYHTKTYDEWWQCDNLHEFRTVKDGTKPHTLTPTGEKIPWETCPYGCGFVVTWRVTYKCTAPTNNIFYKYEHVSHNCTR